MRKAIRIVLILFFFAVFLFAGWKLLEIFGEYRQGEEEYRQMEQFVVLPESVQGATLQTQPAESQGETVAAANSDQNPIRWPKVDFEALQKMNPDIVGWICVEGTKINYPIVQGKNNDQYLYRTVTGKRNSAGSIFLDAKAEPDFSDRNSPIYGHNMKNGSMFADVTDYKSQKFYNKHPVALLMTPDGNFVVKLFSGYTTKDSSDAWDMEFSDQEFQKWLDKRVQKSYFKAKVKPDSQDYILTLSTCTYETDDARFVLHGILVEE